MRALFVLALAASLGCGKEAAETSGDDDDGEPRPRSSRKAKEKLPDGAVVTVRGHDVSIDGDAAGTTRHVDDLGRLQKIDALFDGLKEKREAFKAKNPDQSFPGQLVLRCDEGVSLLAFKSVFQTAAYAGYPHISVEVSTEPAAFVAVEAQIPGPPGGRITVEPKELHVELGPSMTRMVSKGGANAVTASLQLGVSKETEGALRQALLLELVRERVDEVLLYADDTLRFSALAAAFRAAASVRAELEKELEKEKVRLRITFAVKARGDSAPGADDALPAPSASAGRLPPEVIQRIVRGNFGKLRACYDAGLKANPNLQGRVTVKFVIARDGTVSSAQGGGDLPDETVKSCVTKQFYGFTFPPPEGGIVTVSYPIVFTPGG